MASHCRIGVLRSAVSEPSHADISGEASVTATRIGGNIAVNSRRPPRTKRAEARRGSDAAVSANAGNITPASAPGTIASLVIASYGVA